MAESNKRQVLIAARGTIIEELQLDNAGRSTRFPHIAKCTVKRPVKEGPIQVQCRFDKPFYITGSFYQTISEFSAELAYEEDGLTWGDIAYLLPEQFSNLLAGHDSISLDDPIGTSVGRLVDLVDLCHSRLFDEAEGRQIWYEEHMAMVDRFHQRVWTCVGVNAP